MALPDGIVPLQIYVPKDVKDFYAKLAEEENNKLSRMIVLVLMREKQRLQAEKQNLSIAA